MKKKFKRACFTLPLKREIRQSYLLTGNIKDSYYYQPHKATESSFCFPAMGGRKHTQERKINEN